MVRVDTTSFFLIVLASAIAAATVAVLPRLGARGWLLSVALAYAIGGVLAALGVIDSLIYTGSAMATTAITPDDSHREQRDPDCDQDEAAPP